MRSTTCPTPDLLSQLIVAAERECAAQKANEVQAAIKVLSGQATRAEGGRYRLRIERWLPWLKRGARARLAPFGDAAPQVEIDRVGHDWVEVLCEDAGTVRKITGATLTLEGSHLTTALVRRLRELRGNHRHNFLAEKALGVGSPLHQRSQAVLSPELSLRLNEEQLDSVSCALRYDVSWIWGPPGTGKTTTVAELIVERKRLGLRTLVIAPTNRAVDVLASRTADLVRSAAPGELVRAGTRLTEEFDSDGSVWPLAVCAKRSGLTQADVLSFASVVFCTADYLYLSGNCGSFDGVIIDEAALLPPTKLYVAAAHATTSLTLAGDFMQGRPIAETHQADSRRLLCMDTFRRMGIPDDIDRDDPPPYLVQLAEQHRLPPDVRQWVDDVWYGGRLRDSAERKRRGARKSSLGSGTLMLVDTSDLRPMPSRAEGGSISNTEHVRVIRALLGYLMDSYDFGPEPVEGGVMVITPFAAQRLALLRSIPESYMDAGLGIHTAYEVQGHEIGTVILDTTVGGTTPRSGLLSANRPSDSAASAVLVGATRCSERLIVVADLAALERCGGAVARKFASTLRVHADQVALQELEISAAGIGLAQV